MTLKAHFEVDGENSGIYGSISNQDYSGIYHNFHFHSLIPLEAAPAEAVWPAEAACMEAVEVVEAVDDVTS